MEEDTNTLREEYSKFYVLKFPDRYPTEEEMINWWLNKFNQKLEEIEELIETERIDFDSLDTLVKKVFDSHNTALDLALQIIKNKKI